MANIDYIGWTSDKLYAGKVELSTTSIKVFRNSTRLDPKSAYIVYFDANTGIYLSRKGRNLRFQANGKKIMK